MADDPRSRPRRALMLAGGWMHPAEDPVAAVSALLSARGFTVEVVTDPDGPLPIDGIDLLVVAACWFSMTDERYDADQRAAWAVGGDERRERALLAAADGGIPLLALHSAVICFDTWPSWGRWLGGRWNWATSHHPPPGDLTVVPLAGAPVDVGPFTVVDEEYQGLDVEPDVTIVARSAAGHPLVWLNDHAGRRAAVSVLGHDRRSLDRPEHRALLDRLLDWLLVDATSRSGAAAS